MLTRGRMLFPHAATAATAATRARLATVCRGSASMVSSRAFQSVVCPVSMSSATTPSERYGFYADDGYSTVFSLTGARTLDDFSSPIDWEREAHLERGLGLLEPDVQGRVGVHADQARKSSAPSSFASLWWEDMESASHPLGDAVLEPSLLHPAPSLLMPAEPKLLSASLSLFVPGAARLAGDGGIFEILSEIIAAHTPGADASMVEVDVVTVKKCPDAGQVGSCLLVDYHVDMSAEDCELASLGNDFTEAALEAIAAELVDRMADLHVAQEFR